VFSGDLFAHSSLDEELQSHTDYVRRQINAIDSTDDLSEKESELAEGAHVGACTLDRENATFDVTETGSGNQVTVTIPVHGNDRLLSIKAPGHPRSGPYAVYQEGRWSNDGQATLKISATFGTEGTSDAVRSWAKKQIDVIEAKLEAMRPAIEKYNHDIGDQVGQWIAERRRILANTAELRDGLGRGI
jgi:hypothetical protein